MRTIKYYVMAVLIALATNVSALEYDLRDKWVGEYIGTCDWTQGSKSLNGKEFRLIILKGNKFDLTYSYGDRSYQIIIKVIIPKEYNTIKQLSLIDSSIKLLPITGRPQELMIERAKGPFNDEILKGSLVFYQVTSDGKAKISIKVSQFAAGLMN